MRAETMHYWDQVGHVLPVAARCCLCDPSAAVSGGCVRGLCCATDLTSLAMYMEVHARCQGATALVLPGAHCLALCLHAGGCGTLRSSLRAHFAAAVM
jgi:hypothetical protein